MLGTVGSGLRAQILDDSTVMRFSAGTIRYRTEEQMSRNQNSMRLDTSLSYFSEKGDFLFQDQQMFQNLGVFGTAGQNLYYQMPVSIGLRSGMEMFDHLLPNRNEIAYFNTFSPFSEIRYTQGARQRASLKTTFSVNPGRGLNLTGYYQRMTGARILNVTQAEERLTDHHSLYVSGNFSDSSGRYRAWGHYQHSNILQYETGGGKLPSSGNSDSLFLASDIAQVQISRDARNRELRNNWYFSQVWKPFRKLFYLRTSHYRGRQVNRYEDPKPVVDFYGVDRLALQRSPIIGETSDSLLALRSFQVFENTLYAGIQDSVQTTEVYLRRRDLKYFNNLQTFLVPEAEWIAGFRFAGLYKGNQALLQAEYLNLDQFDLKGSILLKGWNLEARLMSWMPSVVEQTFVSKNLLYQTNFKASRGLQLKGEKRFQLGKWYIRPGFEQFTISNGVAFGADFLPFQEDQISVMQYASLGFGGSAGRIHTDNRLIRVFQSGGRISRMPGYVYRSTHWFDLVRNRKAYGVQLGLNLDWRTDWTTEQFHPLSGQWYLSDQTIPTYFLLDAFAHVRIDRVRIYFKVHNVLQGLGSPGYFAAPLYPAQRRLFEVGLNWRFFD